MRTIGHIGTAFAAAAASALLAGCGPSGGDADSGDGSSAGSTAAGTSATTSSATGTTAGSGSASTSTSAPPTPTTTASGGDSPSTAGGPGGVHKTSGGGAPLSLSGLLSAPYPAMCQNPAGKLVDGRKSGGGRGHVRVVTAADPAYHPKAAASRLTDLDGDGHDEIVATFDCDAGGVTWPDVVVVYRQGWRIAGVFDLGEVTRYPDGPAGKGMVTALVPDGRSGTEVRWNSAPSGPDLSDRNSARIVLRSGTARLTDVTGPTATSPSAGLPRDDTPGSPTSTPSVPSATSSPDGAATTRTLTGTPAR